MPRKRADYRKTFHVFPKDFPRRLERFKEASGLTWREIARCLGTNIQHLGCRGYLRHPG